MAAHARDAVPDDSFDVQAFLDSTGAARQIADFRPAQVIAHQGAPCDHVHYLQKGRVKLSVVSTAGREAVVAILGRGEFFGDGCLTGQAVHPTSAVALTVSRVLLVDKREMHRVLRAHRAMSDRFIAHLLARNLRAEEDLLDQLFNSIEKRLARALLLLARYGDTDDNPAKGEPRTLPPITQTTLAEMIGTTRSRVNHFLGKFERMGFIDRKDGLKVYNSLVRVVLGD